MDARPNKLYIPDTMITWPWPRVINPHFEDVKAEINTSLRALNPESHREVFDQSDIARLIAMAYFDTPREYLPIGCELINIYVLVEEYTDTENEVVTQEIADMMLDALHNPHKIRPEGECILGEITRQFWAHVIQFASLPSQRHFLETFTAYLHSVVVEARDREQGHRRSIEDYMKLRRDTIGAKPCLAIFEMEVDLPDDVFYHPVISDIAVCIADIIIIDNDIISYNKEQAVGNADHNLITILMWELGLDIGGAMAWAARRHAEVQKRFIDGLAKVPSWGPSVDVLVKEYVDRSVHWPRANVCWSYESQRYFGTKGPEIQHTRLDPLLPKANRETV